MKININQETCIGCGTCKGLCPEVFDLDENEKAFVIKGTGIENCKADIKNVISACPVQAISVEE